MGLTSVNLHTSHAFRPRLRKGTNMSNKYHWTHTTKANRDPGTVHLCREEVRTYDDGTPYVSGGEPVCGARPWAYGGAAGDEANHLKCARYLKFEKENL